MNGQFFATGWKTAMDARITANANAIAGLGSKRLDVTIATSDWTLNQSTQKYEYTQNNTHITADTFIDTVIDEENAAKLTDGAISSANGSFKIVTSVAPTSSVTMTLVLIETTDITNE